MGGATGPSGASGASGPSGPYVEITRAEMHGSDMIDVGGFVDGEPVNLYVPVAEITGAKSQKRKQLARLLRAAKPKASADLGLTGRENL